MRHPISTNRGRRALALGVIGFALAGISLAPPAAAVADSGSTTVTFTAGVTGGLTILPTPAAVGVGAGNSVTGVIGGVITDLRVGGGTWTDTVTASSFDLVGATAPSVSDGTRAPATAVSMWTTSATVAIPGTATITNNYPDAANALTLSGTGDELVSAVTSNVNVTTLVGGFTIDVTGLQTGAYLGTITQTVS